MPKLLRQQPAKPLVPPPLRPIRSRSKMINVLVGSPCPLRPGPCPFAHAPPSGIGEEAAARVSASGKPHASDLAVETPIRRPTTSVSQSPRHAIRRLERRAPPEPCLPSCLLVYAAAESNLDVRSVGHGGRCGNSSGRSRGRDARTSSDTCRRLPLACPSFLFLRLAPRRRQRR